MSKIDSYQLSKVAVRRLQGLTTDQRRRALRAINRLMRAPLADDVLKREIPFPYRGDTLTASIDGVSITYSVDAEILTIYFIKLHP